MKNSALKADIFDMVVSLVIMAAGLSVSAVLL